MKVLIDIGNSRTKYCYVNNTSNNSFTQVKVVNNEDFHVSLFVKIFSDADSVIVANVASDSLTAQLVNWCKTQSIKYKEVKSEQCRGNVISAYDQPEQLGIDRWLTLIAVSELYPKRSVLIIDAGTATTVDLLADSGKHLGGWILAGVSTLSTSVLDGTAKVNAKLVEEENIEFGKNTTMNVNNACWAATVGLINQAIYQAKQDLTHLDEIIITGGNSRALKKLVLAEMTQIDDLVFYGLNSYS